MNVRGRHTSVRLNGFNPNVLVPRKFREGGGGRKPKIKFLYKFKINNVWYFTVVKRNLEIAEQFAIAKARQTQGNDATISLVSITKIK